MLPNGLKPSLAKPSHTLRESAANQACFFYQILSTVLILVTNGHTNFPLVDHLVKFVYARKSFIVHNNVAYNLNECCIDVSYILMPLFHNSFKSSTNGRKYTSIFFLGALRPRISKDKIIYRSFIHLHWGKLYGISTTGNMLYDVLMMLPNGLKPLLVKPSHTLREFAANQTCFFIKFFPHYWISRMSMLGNLDPGW